MFVAIQASAQTTSATTNTVQRVKDEIIINKMPIKDFGRYVAEKVEKDKVDLNAPFAFAFKTILRNNKLDSTKSKFANITGSGEVIEIVKRGILAINDSGYLQYLEQLNGKSGVVIIQQDKDSFSVAINIELENELEAKKIASAYNLLLNVAIMQKKREANSINGQNRKDELLLLKSIKISTENKFLMLNFSMPQAVKQEMINRKLDELKMRNY
jgi:hypothetical protein